jgi:hypothetical protein
MNLIARTLDLLLGEPLPLPPELPAELLPTGVRLRSGRILPALGGFFARLGGPAAAVTLRRTIVVHPGTRLTRRLLAHELAHVRQWDEDRLFPLRYVAQTLQYGYSANSYEQLARKAEGEGPTSEVGSEK